jgi:anti-anti-sigma factor
MLIEVERQSDVCILRLEGRLVTGTDPKYLLTKTSEIKSLNCNKVLVDVRALLSIGSTGIGFLVGIYTSVTKSPGGRFVLVGCKRRVREVFDITRLSTIIPSLPDIESGLAALRDKGTASQSAGKK